MIYRLGDLVDNFDSRRIPLSSMQRQNMSKKYPYYGATGIFDHVDDYIFDGDYLLLAEDGTVLRDNKYPVLQRISGQTWVNNHAHVLKAKEEIVLQDYLYYALYITDITPRVTGAVQLKLNQKNMNEIELEIPDLKTQHKIVRILSILDKKIELNNKNNENLFEVIKGLFNRQFIGRIYGDKRISDYLIPRRGKNLLSKNAKKGNIPVIAGGLNPAAYHNQSNTLSPVVTISASGANAGYIRLWGENVWASDSSYIDNSITESVYFWYILLKIRQDEIYNKQIGSAQAHIYPRHIGEMGVGDIDCAEMLEYSKKVKVFFEKMLKNEQENKTLLLLRDTLLPKLISGEIKLDKISKE